MRNPDRDPSSALKFIASMLIFGTIGLFRRHIPFSSGLLAFARGALGGLFLICFACSAMKVAVMVIGGIIAYNGLSNLRIERRYRQAGK